MDHFPLFPHLPKELRLLIWEEALLSVPGQVLDLSTIMDEDLSVNSDCMRFTLPPPLLSYVSAESRTVALRFGQSFNLTHRYRTGWGRTSTAAVRTWFSGGRDLLELAAERGYDRKRAWVFDSEMMKLLARAEHVMLLPGADEEFLARILAPGTCPRVRKVDVMLERFEVADAEAMDPLDVVDFFGEERLVLLDMEDVSRARRLMERYPCWKPSPYWVKKWYDFSQTDEGALVETIAQAKRRVRDAWLGTRMPGSNTASADVDEEKAWRTETAVLRSMPRIRTVRCCDWPYAGIDSDNNTLWSWRDDTELKMALEELKGGLEGCCKDISL